MSKGRKGAARRRKGVCHGLTHGVEEHRGERNLQPDGQQAPLVWILSWAVQTSYTHGGLSAYSPIMCFLVYSVSTAIAAMMHGVCWCMYANDGDMSCLLHHVAWICNSFSQTQDR